MQHQQLTFLIVEDNPDEVILLQRAFQRADLGVAAQFVENGEEAIDYLSGQDCYTDRDTYPEPDLVIMDLKMPRKGGFEVLEWFRNIQEGALIPIVILTSSEREADIQRAYSLGANSYFIKPAHFDGLLSVLQAIYQYWSLSQRPRSLLVSP